MGEEHSPLCLGLIYLLTGHFCSGCLSPSLHLWKTGPKVLALNSLPAVLSLSPASAQVRHGCCQYCCSLRPELNSCPSGCAEQNVLLENTPGATQPLAPASGFRTPHNSCSPVAFRETCNTSQVWGILKIYLNTTCWVGWFVLVCCFLGVCFCFCFFFLRDTSRLPKS